MVLILLPFRWSVLRQLSLVSGNRSERLEKSLYSSVRDVRVGGNKYDGPFNDRVERSFELASIDVTSLNWWERRHISSQERIVSSRLRFVIPANAF